MNNFPNKSIEIKGRESTVNIALDGITYLSEKLVPSSLCGKKLFVKEHNNLYLGLVTPSSG
jgi:hypothetical protein